MSVCFLCTSDPLPLRGTVGNVITVYHVGFAAAREDGRGRNDGQCRGGESGGVYRTLLTWVFFEIGLSLKTRTEGRKEGEKEARGREPYLGSRARSQLRNGMSATRNVLRRPPAGQAQ